MYSYEIKRMDGIERGKLKKMLLYQKNLSFQVQLFVRDRLIEYLSNFVFYLPFIVYVYASSSCYCVECMVTLNKSHKKILSTLCIPLPNKGLIVSDQKTQTIRKNFPECFEKRIKLSLGHSFVLHFEYFSLQGRRDEFQALAP